MSSWCQEKYRYCMALYIQFSLSTNVFIFPTTRYPLQPSRQGFRTKRSPNLLDAINLPLRVKHNRHRLSPALQLDKLKFYWYGQLVWTPAVGALFVCFCVRACVRAAAVVCVCVCMCVCSCLYPSQVMTP